MRWHKLAAALRVVAVLPVEGRRVGARLREGLEPAEPQELAPAALRVRARVVLAQAAVRRRQIQAWAVISAPDVVSVCIGAAMTWRR